MHFAILQHSTIARKMLHMLVLFVDKTFSKQSREVKAWQSCYSAFSLTAVLHIGREEAAIGALPSSEKGKAEASPIDPPARGNSSLVGPVSMLDVATVSITFSPITFGEPNTQKTSANTASFDIPS